MNKDESQAGTKAQQSTEADTTTSSSHNAKPLVVRSPFSLANELRIWNWIADASKVWLHVEGITNSDAEGRRKIVYKTKSGLSMFELEYSQPISLTPEILVACGFQKFSHEPGYKVGSDFLDEKDERCDEYTKGKLTIMDWGNGFVLSNSFSFSLRVELKHLHQLQNLYFALTGNELEINVAGVLR